VGGSGRFSGFERREKISMHKRNLRVVKWLSSTPAIGSCSFCGKQFKVPMTCLSKTVDAKANLQEQFDRHKCEGRSGSEHEAAVIQTPAV
jgi:hypothetical protein